MKRLSGIQEQLLSLCMGKHQILQNCSLNLRLNFIFEITNEIGQQLCHKCCLFCSNSVIKNVFLRLDQPVRMCSPERASQRLTVSIATGTSKGSCSDALTLPISDWLFHSEGGASCDRAAILTVAFFPIQNYTSDMSWVFYSLCLRSVKSDSCSSCWMQGCQVHVFSNLAFF